MRLISWNVNGLRAVLKKDFLIFLKNVQFDILCLQETKCREQEVPQEFFDALPEEYIHFSSAERKGYSGVCIISRVKPLEVSEGMGIEAFDHEGRVLRMRFTGFILYNVYFPNGQKDEERLQFKLDFYKSFFNRLEEERKEGYKIIVCGDYNTAHHPIDLAHPKANEKYSGFLPVERAELDRIEALGWIDTFRILHPDERKYSWWSYRFRARDKNVGWRIDYFFITSELKKKLLSAFIMSDIFGSDHCPVGIELKKSFRKG